MNNKHTEQWLSTHIYYNEPWELFFHESLLPFVDTAVKTGIISQYFFVRYWERGPHLRLRMKGDPSLFESILLPNLKEHFSNFMDRYPSTRVDPNYPENFPSDYKWYSNNTLLFLPYIPETTRYAGAVGLSISEEQFFYSSQTILEVLKNNQQEWTYDDAMGNAIQMHLIFAHAMDLSLEEAISFFHFFYKNWLDKPSELSQRDNSRGEVVQETLEKEHTFKRAFEFQKEFLQTHLTQLWNAMENDYQQLPQHLQQWHFNNQVIAKKLEQANSLGNLAARSKDYQYLFAAPHSKQTLWSLYADFVHLSNNRLGIVNRDESFIAFIIMQSLKSIQGESSSDSEGLRVEA